MIHDMRGNNGVLRSGYIFPVRHIHEIRSPHAVIVEILSISDPIWIGEIGLG